MADKRSVQDRYPKNEHGFEAMYVSLYLTLRFPQSPVVPIRRCLFTLVDVVLKKALAEYLALIRAVPALEDSYITR